jgi:hypothetical protein
MRPRVLLVVRARVLRELRLALLSSSCLRWRLELEYGGVGQSVPLLVLALPRHGGVREGGALSALRALLRLLAAHRPDAPAVAAEEHRRGQRVVARRVRVLVRVRAEREVLEQVLRRCGLWAVGVWAV